jgi:hypothetical protein
MAGTFTGKHFGGHFLDFNSKLEVFIFEPLIKRNLQMNFVLPKKNARICKVK